MAQKYNIIREKSFSFAVRTVNLYKTLKTNRKETVLSKQILRSGTSIGANVREGINAESKSDFIHKLAIAQKETDETIFWLELLAETDYLKESEFQSMKSDAEELLKIIRTIIMNTKANLKR